jgi:hypothetical protein
VHSAFTMSSEANARMGVVAGHSAFTKSIEANARMDAVAGHSAFTKSIEANARMGAAAGQFANTISSGHRVFCVTAAIFASIRSGKLIANHVMEPTYAPTATVTR